MSAASIETPVIVAADSRRGRALVLVLIFVGLLVAVVSSLGAPLVPTISTDYGISLGTAQWSLTITLLVGAVTSPVVGRLGDGPHRRAVLLTALAVLVLGSVLAALPTTHFALLIAGRGMQGVGLSLLPLVMSVARDHLDAVKGRSTLATLSVTAVVGVGLGYPITGLVAEHISFRAGFWIAAGLGLAAMIAVAGVVPRSVHRPAQHFDLPGAVLLGLALVGLLVAVSESENWGWGSARLWIVLAAVVVVAAVWARHELRSAMPLIDLRLLRHRSVLTANLAGLIAGIGMYMLMSMIIRYVQTPSSVSYGLGASVVVAGLLLLPLSAFSFASSRFVAYVGRWVPAERVLPLGVLVLAGALLTLATARGSLWELFVVMGIGGIGVGCSFAVMPMMIVSSIPADETSSALALNQVLRTIGYSIGSALAATILTAHTQGSSAFPDERGYTVGCLVGVGLCLVAALLSWVLPSVARVRRDTTPDEQLQIDDEVNAAISGTLTLEDTRSPMQRAS